MDINRELSNLLAELTNERYRVDFVSAWGLHKTVEDNIIGLLAYTIPSDEIISVERVR